MRSLQKTPEIVHGHLDDSLRAPYCLNQKRVLLLHQNRKKKKSNEIDRCHDKNAKESRGCHQQWYKNTTTCEVLLYSEVSSVGPGAKSPGFKSQVRYILAV